MKHYSVMGKEAIEFLNIQKDKIYVDATLGYASLSSKILKKLNNKGLLIGIDQDEEAIKYSNNILKKIGKNYKLLNINFSNLKEALNELEIKKVDGIVFDLGLSSPQIDDEKRGFSFMKNSILDMRMDLRNSLTAKDIVNNYEEEKLSKIFFTYGEERKSHLIAKQIVLMRKEKEIVTTFDLVNVILLAVGNNYFYKTHPERRIFQAIRIEVNNELEVLKRGLKDAIELLAINGRLVVITFHSLEDRIVKNIFKENSEVCSLLKGTPNIPKEYLPKIKLITKKPIVPREEEIKENSRSHSAKMRVIERI